MSGSHRRFYDRLHAWFLRLSGGEGQSAIEGAVTALLRPGLRIFDADCGTGRLAQRLLESEPDLDITLFDASGCLLHASSHLPVRRLYGDVTDISLPDRRFDLTLAFWVIEAGGAGAVRDCRRASKHHCPCITSAEDALTRLKGMLDATRLQHLTRTSLVSVSPFEVIRFQGADDYVEACLASSSHLLSVTTEALENALARPFVRAHRSHIVNVDHVRSNAVVGGRVILPMADASIIPVSRSRKGDPGAIFSNR